MSPGALFIQVPSSGGNAKMIYCPYRKLICFDYSLKDDSHSAVCRLEGVDEVLYVYENSKNILRKY